MTHGSEPLICRCRLSFKVKTMTLRQSTVTHFAGPSVAIGGRWIQRCAVCGEKLYDSKYDRAAAKGGPPTVGYKPLSLIRLSPGDPALWTVIGNLADTPDLPDDNCLPLVE
jgi:hypothetical protein